MSDVYDFANEWEQTRGAWPAPKLCDEAIGLVARFDVQHLSIVVVEDDRASMLDALAWCTDEAAARWVPLVYVRGEAMPSEMCAWVAEYLDEYIPF